MAKMNNGKFRAEMEAAYKFLSDLGLAKISNAAKIHRCEGKKFSSNLHSIEKKEGYIGVYQYAIAYNEYDILMNDFSFFQFSFDKAENVIRMAYYPNPDTIHTFEQYMGYIENNNILTGEDEWRYREEYDNYMDNHIPSAGVTPFRYDYSEKEYQGLIHSTSHFHFGQTSTVRVACAMQISPLCFAVLVVNYYYYSVWKEKLLKDEEFKKLVLSVKEKCELVDERYFSQSERRFFSIC